MSYCDIIAIAVAYIYTLVHGLTRQAKARVRATATPVSLQ